MADGTSVEGHRHHAAARLTTPATGTIHLSEHLFGYNGPAMCAQIAAEIRDGMLYGRGAADMKGASAVALSLEPAGGSASEGCTR